MRLTKNKIPLWALAFCLALQLSCDLDKIEFPTVTTLDPIREDGLATTFMGRVNASNLSEIAEYGFAWSGTTSTPEVDVDESMVASGIDASLEYSLKSSGFTENISEYHVRAYIVLRDSLKYGDPISFSFQSFAISMGAINVFNDSVAIEGFLTVLDEDKFQGVIDHGHVISESQNPTIADMRVSLGNRDRTGGFLSSFTLDYNKKYYSRAYAITEDDTIYTPSSEVIVNDGWNQLNAFTYPYYFGVGDADNGSAIVGLGCNFICSPDQEYALWQMTAVDKDSMTMDRIDGLEPELEFLPRGSGSGFAIDDKFYFGLGRDNNGTTYNSFYNIDLNSRLWDYNVPDFPGTPRSNAVGLEFGGNAYVGFGESGGSRFSDLYRFDPATGWTDSIANPYADAGEGITSIATTATEDAIYFIGGNSSAGAVNTVYEYRPSSGEWKEMAPIPGASEGKRYEAIAFTINGKVYAGAGWGGDLDKVYSDFYILDPAENEWESIAPFDGVGRFGAVAFVLDGKAYIGAGQDRDGRALSDLWIYNPEKN